MSPFNDMLTIISERNDKALRQAFYNTIAIIFVAFVLVSVVAVYFVLEPFLQPLLWSLLFGSALHPFKQKLTHLVKLWLTNQDKKPATLYAIVMPFTIFNYFLNLVAKIVIQYYKLLLFIFFALLLTHLGAFYFTITHRLITFFTILINLCIKLTFIFLNFCNIYLFSTLLTAHLCIYYFFPSPLNRKFSSSLVFSIIVSLLVIKLLLSFGTIGYIGLLSLIIITITGLFFTLMGTEHESNDKTDAVQVFRNEFLQSLSHCWNSLMSMLLTCPEAESERQLIAGEEETLVKSHSPALVSKIKGDVCDLTPLSSYKSSSLTCNTNLGKKSSKKKESNLSNSYLYALLWSCLLAQVWLRPSILYLFLISISIFLIKWAGNKINEYSVVSDILNRLEAAIRLQLSSLIHPIFWTFYKYFLIGDKFVRLDCLFLKN